MFIGLVAAAVVAAGAAQDVADPCWDAYKARLKQIDQWEQNCISAPIPGPTPCIDWPECCSVEAEQMRKQAVIDLFNCWFPPVPPSPGN